MNKKYFSTNYAIDEDFLGIVEDSIYFNPLITKEDKDVLVTTLYSNFHEAVKPEQVYTMHRLEKKYKAPTAYEATKLAPDLLELARQIVLAVEVEKANIPADILDAAKKISEEWEDK